jgi:lysophospholipase L1-like esterase
MRSLPPLSFSGVFVLLVSFIAVPGFAQNTSLNPAAYDHPVRLAMIGDSITFGSGTTMPGGRVGLQIPGATPAQQAAGLEMTNATAELAAAVTQARTALQGAAVSGAADRAALQAAADLLAEAELKLALARAAVLRRWQDSPDRLNAVQLASLVQQSSPAPAAGARGGFVLPNTPNSYPAQLAVMLGSGWELRNFGISGATLLKKGDMPYWNQAAFQAALDFNPDVVVIMLGTNDSKPQNWKFSSEFVPDYEEMIARFAALPSHPKIWIAKPMPAFSSAFAISETVIAGEVIPRIEQIARDTQVGLIDQYAAMKAHGDLVPDGIHPNTDGARFLAATVHTTLTGQAAPSALR